MEVSYIWILMLGSFALCYGQWDPPLPPHCAAAICPQTTCPNPIRRPGQCCGICLEDCSVRFCPRPPTHCESYIPRGRCCSECRPGTPNKPNCRNVICPDMSYCRRDVFTPPGQCCPRCPGHSSYRARYRGRGSGGRSQYGPTDRY